MEETGRYLDDKNRSKWCPTDINPTKLVKGQGLAKLLADSNCQSLGLPLMT